VNWRRLIPPLVVAGLLALGLFVLHWRRIEFGDVAVQLGPNWVDACGASEGCQPGEKFGFTVAGIHGQFGSGFATAMQLAFWTVLVALCTQAGLGVLVLLGARDRWLPRIVAAVACLAAAVATATIVYAVMVNSDHSGPGLWLTLAAALAGVVTPLVRRKKPVDAPA
jgi:hypothetical protein